MRLGASRKPVRETAHLGGSFVARDSLDWPLDGVLEAASTFEDCCQPSSISCTSARPTAAGPTQCSFGPVHASVAGLHKRKHGQSSD